MQYVKGSVWIAEGFFSESEVKEIHAVANKRDWDTGQVGDGIGIDPDSPNIDTGAVREDIRQSQVKWLEHEHLAQNFHSKLARGIKHASGDKDWDWDFTHFESFQYTNYRHKPDKRRGDFYTWHTDSAGTKTQYPDGSIRKLSCTIQLSDPDEYEGGKFQWLEPNGQYDSMKKGSLNLNMDESIRTLPFSCQALGSMCLFPSFLYHQVTPVTRGTRVSIVGWYNGPPWT